MDDDLGFLEDAMSDIEAKQLKEKLGTLNQDELCQLLGIKGEHGEASGDTLFIYHLCEGDVFPEEVKRKIKEHYDECYPCGELYRDFLNREKWYREPFS